MSTEPDDVQPNPPPCQLLIKRILTTGLSSAYPAGWASVALDFEARCKYTIRMVFKIFLWLTY